MRGFSIDVNRSKIALVRIFKADAGPPFQTADPPFPGKLQAQL